MPKNRHTEMSAPATVNDMKHDWNKNPVRGDMPSWARPQQYTPTCGTGPNMGYGSANNNTWN